MYILNKAQEIIATLTPFHTFYSFHSVLTTHMHYAQQVSCLYSILCFISCGYAILICRALAPFYSAAFALSQVIRRAVYGVVIVSYIAPYLPEILSFVNVALLISGTLSLFQSGVWHIHDHDTP